MCDDESTCEIDLEEEERHARIANTNCVEGIYDCLSTAVYFLVGSVNRRDGGG